MLRECILQLSKRENLSAMQCTAALDDLFHPNSNMMQAAALLALLHAKGENTEEILSFARYLKNKMIPIHTKSKTLDLVGTGGDGANTVNISTGSAILAGSAGVHIAKHGNRSVSSLSGAADVIEALGVPLSDNPQFIADCIDHIGIGFIYAPYFHPCLAKIRELRRLLNIPTIFNLLGPLLNPASPNYLLLGVAKKELQASLAALTKDIGITHSITVHSDGLDEMHTAALIDMIEMKNNALSMTMLDPATLGFSPAKRSDLKGGHAKENAEILMGALQGKKGPIADTLILNAGTAIYLYGITININEGIALARENLFSGKALSFLTHWIEYSHDTLS